MAFWKKHIVRLLLVGSIALMPFNWLFANETWECKSSYGNVSIIATADYGDTLKTQLIFNEFLLKLSDVLHLKSSSFKILILTDPYGFNLARRDTNGFSTIAYDTLRAVDLGILMEKMSYNSFQKKNDPESRVFLPDTLDFGVTSDSTQNELGLKIIFRHSRSDTSYQFDRIYSLVKFGLENINLIKSTQRNLYVTTYGMNMVAVKTFDTSRINKIETFKLGFDPHNLPKKTNPFIAIMIGLTIIIGLLALFKKRT